MFEISGVSWSEGGFRVDPLKRPGYTVGRKDQGFAEFA